MKLTINNSDRLFIIVCSTGHTHACNLEQINSVIVNEGLIDGYYKIYELWNGKMKVVSKKFLAQLYAANEIDPNNKVVSIHIETLGYWDKTYGNPYIAGWITINWGLQTAETFPIKFQYGSRSMASQITHGILSEKGLLPEFDFTSKMESYIKRNGIVVTYSHKDGCKFSELKSIK